MAKIEQEGEIILKECYGSEKREVYYVKPQGQHNVVILDKRKGDMTNWLSKVFLPQGYPESVSKDYIAYQIWDTAQAFCSTITGTLATQEVLRGVGVGSTSATPLSATIIWVVKDGCGHLGKILFAYSHGSHLDAYSKKWRIYADTLNDAAMCVEIALPYFKNYTTLVLCLSTVMKAIVGVAGGATRAAMTQHHAIRGNLADVAAKDSAQETAVNLVASFTALFIISMFGNSLMIFVVMTILHIIFNYMAVRAVCLRTLNEPRLLQFIDVYLKQEAIAVPCVINANEPIIFYQLGPNLLDLKLCGFQIKMGGSLKKLIKHYPKANHLKMVVNVYTDRNYILFSNVKKRMMYIEFKEGAATDDMLLGYFHAVLLSIIICAINDYSLPVYSNTQNPRPFAQVCQILQGSAWTRDPITNVSSTYNSNFLYEPSIDLLKYVDKIAQKEWVRIKDGLIQTGWDLSKHLLMVDEWRVCKIENTTSLGSFSSPNFTKSKPFRDVLEEIKQPSEQSFVIEPESTDVPRTTSGVESKMQLPRTLSNTTTASATRNIQETPEDNNTKEQSKQ